MIQKFLLPILSLAGLLLAFHTVAQGERPTPAAPPAAEPAEAPFPRTIAGSGIVEAASQNIAIGTPLSGVIAEVPVVQSQSVAAGAILFRLDDREFRAEADVRRAILEAARAELAQLAALPRAEDLPPARARAESAEAWWRDAEAQLARARAIADARAISVEELERRAASEKAARANFAEARAELDKLVAGAWAPDLALARAQVARAEAQVAQIETQLERLVVRAPIDGVVLQVNARPGEFAQSGVLRDPLILFGSLARLHVRVDIDESEAWRLTPGAAARATVRGNRDLAAPLEFVRIDPYVVPKRSLTGDTSERVDTRVLQVIFSFDPAALPVYVGQQMDVFIEATAQPARGR
jgi:HlyD family secretion protein